jgi:hypothetical protein
MLSAKMENPAPRVLQQTDDGTLSETSTINVALKT